MNASLSQAADVLWDCWQHGRRLSSIPDDIRPRTREEGYSVQALLEERSAAPLFGRKIAATSATGQAHISITGVRADRLLREKSVSSGAELCFGANHMKVAEADFSFSTGLNPPPLHQTYSSRQMFAALASP